MNVLRKLTLTVIMGSVLYACADSQDAELAKYCLDHAGVIQQEGENAGMCKFQDGSVCDPDLFKRAQCSPGDSL